MKFLTNIDLNQNQIQNFIVQPVATLPPTGVQGQFIFNSTENELYKHDGTRWIIVDTKYVLPPATKTQLGGIKVGTGFTVTSDGVLTVDAPNITAGAVEWSDVLNKPADLVRDANYVHTDNNYTTSEKTKLSGVATGAQVNVIEKIQKNGTNLAITNKTVNIVVPTQASDVSAIPMSDKGKAGGVAELDTSGKVPAAQLPSYVDDVLEYASKSNFPATGETGKIYVTKDTNLTYRWSGSAYVEISVSLALGETAQTAYRGDRGKIAYDHSQVKTGNPHGTKLTDLGVTITAATINGLPNRVTTLENAAPDKISGTIAKGNTSAVINATTGKTIVNTIVYDAVTNEEILCDITYGSGRASATVSIAAAYTNALQILCIAV